MLKVLFWTCFALLFWTYCGYPVWMLVRGRGARRARPLPPLRLPKVSVVLAVRNAAPLLPARLENLFAQSYPEDLLEVLVVLNGCTDGSRDVAERMARTDPRVRLLESSAADGKAGALNLGVEHAAGAVVVFADARQRFAPDVVQLLVNAVMQEGVGAVSGRLEITRDGAAAVEGMRRYWSLEPALRDAESRTGSVMGVTGAIYAIRRDAFVAVPRGTILDDVYLPLRIALAGKRVLLEPAAVAYDAASSSQGSEYRRRVRTLLGNLQLVQLLPLLVRPWRNRVFVRFMSHKLLRVFSPLFFIGLITTGLMLPALPYQLIVGAILVLFGLGLLGMVSSLRPLAVPAALLMIQVAALEAIFRRRRAAVHVWH